MRSWGSADLLREEVRVGSATARRHRPPLRPAAPGKDHRLEAAELGHPVELGDVAGVGQLAVTRLADQPSMLRSVEAAMEEVVELGAGDGPAFLGEDGCACAAGTPTTERLARHRLDDQGLAQPEEAPPLDCALLEDNKPSTP